MCFAGWGTRWEHGEEQGVDEWNGGDFPVVAEIVIGHYE